MNRYSEETRLAIRNANFQICYLLSVRIYKRYQSHHGLSRFEYMALQQHMTSVSKSESNVSHQVVCFRLREVNITQTQTQTQTSFIQQKKIQVQYQVYITFMNIQLIISPWHINDYKHVGRLPLRSYLTAVMEATRKGEACTAVMKTAMQLIIN